MKKYKKQSTESHAWVLGMLHLVTVKLVKKTTKETITHKLLVVGDDASSIEQKMKWLFDKTEYSEMNIKSVEKIKEKVHFLSTTIVQNKDSLSIPVVEKNESTALVTQSFSENEKYDPILFAVGITTTMLAKDENHAIRKVGSALINSATEGNSHSGASLSDDSQIQIEAIPKRSGYAMPRDVSNESNNAVFYRG